MDISQSDSMYPYKSEFTVDVSTVATVDVSFHSVFIQFDNKKCQNVTPETPRI